MLKNFKNILKKLKRNNNLIYQYYKQSRKIPIYLIKKIFLFFGNEISIQSIKKNKNFLNKNHINLNIGAGDYIIPGFKSLDFYSPHYYKSKKQFLKKRIEYDIRKNNIPFEESTVDNIYISHVVEHIESKFVEKFLKEAIRVLKKGSVLRIACPDSKFLYEVSRFSKNYWEWSRGYFESRGFNWNEIKKEDCLIQVLCTPKLKFNKNRRNDYIENNSTIFQNDYKTIINFLKKDLHFRFNHSGDHINCWDFEQLNYLGKKVGFEHVVESKYRGSVSYIMQSPLFDQTFPGMSLYVDMVK